METARGSSAVVAKTNTRFDARTVERAETHIAHTHMATDDSISISLSLSAKKAAPSGGLAGAKQTESFE